MTAQTKGMHGIGKRFALVIGVAAVGVIALGAQTATSTQAGKAPPTCKGLAATIVGTESSDNPLDGTSGRDVIVGLGGDDVLDGGPGNDVICGGADSDKLNGLNDKLNGGQGNDALSGGLGKDKLNGGKGKDNCVGDVFGHQVPPDGVKDTGKSCEKETRIP